MSADTDDFDQLHGRLLANEMITFAVLAMLTESRADKAEVLHNVIGAVDAMVRELPGKTAQEELHKGWASAHWNSIKPLFAGLIHIDPTNGLRQ